MKRISYYQVSNFQLFVMALLIGIISAALITINIAVKEYFQLPLVTLTSDDKCVSVLNFKNGEAFVCGDVGMILRNYRVKKS